MKNIKYIKFCLIISSLIIFSTNCRNKPKEVNLTTKENVTNESSNVDFSKKWLDYIVKNSGFKIFENEKIENVDLSKIISNQLRFEGDPISTYIGIFGPNYHRIDFHINAIKNDSIYIIAGKSNLKNNIRELKGEMKLFKVLLQETNYITDSLYIGLFKTKLQESGDKEGDGIFEGIFTVVFFKLNDEWTFYKTSSGDEPTFTNTFVGHWRKFNSDIKYKCIFSFHPAGLYEKLPFCDEIYTINEGNDDYTLIKGEYEKYGWENFNYKGEKTIWWK